MSNRLLRQKKELMTSYFLLMSVGATGGHHFYLNRLVHGMFCVWTFNFCGLGWVADFFMLPYYVNRCNRGSATVARWDGTLCHVLPRLPCIWFVMIAFPLAFLNYVPTGLHTLQVVDLQAKGAGTVQNPFDVLGVGRDAPAREAAGAYGRRMSTLNKTKRCDSECALEKQELKKANDFISGATFREYKLEQEKKERKDKAVHRRRRRYDDEPAAPSKSKEEQESADAWSDWSSYKRYEWELLIDILKDGIESLANSTRENGTHADDP